MNITFQKMHGLGNDFILLDERHTRYDLSREQLAALGDRRFGIGCDQILRLLPSALDEAIGAYRVVNSDGSPAEHCGNGIRCVARYLQNQGEVGGDEFFVEVDGQPFALAFTTDGQVRVDMGKPNFEPAAIPIASTSAQDTYRIAVDGQDWEFGCVSMGNPHAVHFVEQLVGDDVQRIGRALQSHEFFPQQVNVGFARIESPNALELRVFERGAGETLACGTGACAAAVVGRVAGLLNDSVSVALRGGKLTIEWNGDCNQAVMMTGPATHVFEGIITL